MTYLDPMRIALSGDKTRAQSHVREARAVALGLVQMTLSGGATSGRRVRILPDGTVIEVTKAGNDVTAQIASPGGAEPVEVTIAFVAAQFGAVPGAYIVDVDAETIIDTITFPGYSGRGVNGMAVSPDGQFLYFGLHWTVTIRVDLNAMTATGAEWDFSDGGTTTGANTFFTDLCISPDGERLHYRYTATGIPSGGSSTPSGTYGGIFTLFAADLSAAGTQPNNLFSNRDYLLTVHPIEQDLLYFTAYGDADEDDDPNGDSDDSDDVPESLKYAAWNGSGSLGGDIVWPFFLASSHGAREVIITPNGERAYVTNTRGFTFVNGDLTLHPAPAVVCYDVGGGTLARRENLLMGVDITGSIAVSHDGARISVMEAETGVVRTLEYDADSDSHSEGDSYSSLPEDLSLGDFRGAYRQMHTGPKSKKSPENHDRRLLVVNSREKALMAVKPGGAVDKTVLFENTPSILCVSRARKFVREDRV